MKTRFTAIAFSIAMALPFASIARAQSVVDFREAIRTAEPALLTITVDPSDQKAEPEAIAKDDAQVDPAPQGPRFEFFDLKGKRFAPFVVEGRRKGLANMRPVAMTSAAFAVEESLLIGFVGSSAKSVEVTDRNGERYSGKVISLDHVTGLAAIKVDRPLESTLIVSAAETEPGMPVVATWLDGVLKSDGGMISSRPDASGSGIGMIADVDFGDEDQLVGSPVLDSSGIVVGMLVPGKAGRRVCARSADIQRLVSAATADEPYDLKRGLVGIQFEGGGALVLEVSADSGAADAGIKAGDIITEVGGFRVFDAPDVVAAVASSRAGDAVEVRVERDGESMSFSVTLTDHPDQRLTPFMKDGGVFEMQQAFELKDGKLVPMEIDPKGNAFPQVVPGQPLEEMFKGFPGFNGPRWQAPNQQGGINGFRIERSDVEKTLKELQKQLEELNERLGDEG